MGAGDPPLAFREFAVKANPVALLLAFCCCGKPLNLTFTGLSPPLLVLSEKETWGGRSSSQLHIMTQPGLEVLA